MSVLELVHGFAVMKKSYELLKGETRMAAALVFVYRMICGIISVLFAVRPSL